MGKDEVLKVKDVCYKMCVVLVCPHQMRAISHEEHFSPWIILVDFLVLVPPSRGCVSLARGLLVNA